MNINWDIFYNPLKSLVRPAGFEPAAYGFEVRNKPFDKANDIG